MISRRLVGFIAAYFKRPVPARLALIVLGALIALIVLSTLYVVRYSRPAPHTVPRGTNQSAPPTGYATGEPIPVNTGFQTGDAG